MSIEAPAKLLLIYIDESDRLGDSSIPLYEAIVEFLFEAGVDGATANDGVMGFGTNRRLHKKGLFGITDDRTVTISVIDNEAKLRNLFPKLKSMVGEGLIFLLDGEVIHQGIDSKGNPNE